MGATVVPKSTRPGSKEWIAATIDLAKSWSERSERDVRQLVGYIADLRNHGDSAISEHGSWDSFCREVIGYESDYLDAMERGVTILETRGHRGSISEEQARRAVEQAQYAGDLAKPGEIGRGRNRDSERMSNYGETSDYLAARIKRDHPEILERMKRGEFKSVRAAAIEAGIIKPPSALDLLKRAWNKATARQRQDFLKWTRGAA